MNSTLFARSICIALLRLRLRDIPLTELEVDKTEILFVRGIY
jgi:hypothetical protein